MRIEYNEKGEAKVVRSERYDEPDRNKKNPYKFYSIPYLKVDCLETFKPDDIVWIEEKLDGSNVLCEVDNNDDYRCYGNTFELGTWYTNRGAYEKLLEIEDKVRKHIGQTAVVYFEFLSLHHVRYSADKENHLFVIGVKDKTTRKYWTPDKVHELADKLGLEAPAILYHGYFKDWDTAKSLVGESRCGAVHGEGVIVKAYDERYGIKMVKIVAEDFREIMKYDPGRKQAKLDNAMAKKEKAREIVTEARIRKHLYKLVDEGIIDSVEEMTNDNKTKAIKNIGRLIYEDCIKEEPDFVVEFGKDFGTYSFLLSKEYINSLYMAYKERTENS